MQSASAPGELGAAELRRALASPDPARRAAAVERVRPEPGVEDLLVETVLRDPDPEVRRACVRQLGGFRGPRARRTLAEVASGDLAASVRAEAVGVLGEMLARNAGGDAAAGPEGGGVRS
jgi:HEAT repeat protein